MRRCTLVFLSCLGLFPLPALGQSGADSAGSRALCWRARAEPRCRSFVVTTLAWEMPMFATKRSFETPYGGQETSTLFPGARLAGTVGWMLNRGNAAYGVAGVWGMANEHAREGFDLRYRRWLANNQILDLGAGYVRVDGDATSFTRLTGRGLSLAAEYGQPNFLALVSRYEAVSAPGGMQHGAYLGARVGSFGAPVALSIGIAAAFALLALAYSGS